MHHQLSKINPLHLTNEHYISLITNHHLISGSHFLMRGKKGVLAAEHY